MLEVQCPKTVENLAVSPIDTLIFCSYRHRIGGELDVELGLAV